MMHGLVEPNRFPVLVVEHDEDDFDTVVEAASRADVGNRMVHAVDADSAQGMLVHVPVGCFACMLPGHNLPGQHGLTCLRRIRRNRLLAKRQTTIFTTSRNPRNRDACYDAGALRYWLNRVASPGVAREPLHTRQQA